MLLVLHVSWMTLLEPQKDLQYLELFAGTARLTKLARATGYRAEGHDIDYDAFAKKTGCNNAMDITGDAGFVFLDHSVRSSAIERKHGLLVALRETFSSCLEFLYKGTWCQKLTRLCKGIEQGFLVLLDSV